MKLALALVVVGAGALNLRDWAQWKEHFGKRYANEAEDAQRFDIFLENLEMLDNLVASLDDDDDAVFGITKFFDETPEEFQRSHLNYHPITPPRDDVAAPENITLGRASRSVVNWMGKATTPVKDQGYCGSCWAFSAVEQVESAWTLAGHELTAFSTEQLVECDTAGDDAGCNGGDSPTAYKYIKEAGGLASDEAYPYSKETYSGNAGKCEEFTPVGGAVKTWSYVTPKCTKRKCKDQDEDTLKTAIDAAPASICVNAKNWQAYTGGVMGKNACGDNGYYNLNHCVQLVGYNTDAEKPYWIVRNSWNTNWGEEGLIYLKMGRNTCGLANEAMTVSF